MEDSTASSLLEAVSMCDNVIKRLVMGHRRALTKSQMDVMLGLRFIGPMSMTGVSEHLAASKEQATRAVAPLVEAGYVERRRSAENYRVVEVSITEKGRRYLEQDRIEILREVDDLLSVLDEADRQRLGEASRTMREVVSKLRK
ncbi:MAG: MarR family transcriptional regulator [Eggerthellaceae bacterium]|nr:MarR family transcriptional regulator [Eggerthellaceae bacterium]